MTINDGYIKLGTRLLESASPPQVTSIYIPPKTPVDESTDEFGFVFLEDGSIGPFYVSLDDTRAELERRLVIDGLPNTWSFPHWLERDSLAQRALAIGLFNACSDHVMRRAGFVPTHVPAAGKRDPQPGETNRVEVTESRPSPLPHHRTCGFPHPAVGTSSLIQQAGQTSDGIQNP